jgi:hypothetical protein
MLAHLVVIPSQANDEIVLAVDGVRFLPRPRAVLYIRSWLAEMNAFVTNERVGEPVAFVRSAIATPQRGLCEMLERFDEFFEFNLTEKFSVYEVLAY